MGLIVQKFGGTSVANAERLRNVAQIIADTYRQGNRVVAVMNLSPYAIHADYYTGIYAGMYTDAMTGVACELRGHVEEDMAPWSYRILTR